MESKISVIIPVYNSENTIRKCLKSLLEQSYDNYEAIIVNDGSTDKSKTIINEMIKNDHRFYLINQKNSGSSSARKTGLNNISNDSEYFCFLDSDDYFDKDFLLKMIKTAVINQADIVQCGYSKFIGSYKYNDYLADCLKKNAVYNHDQIMKKLYISYFGISNFPGYLHTKLYKSYLKNIILKLPVKVKFMADDLSINIRILPLCNKIAIITDKLYFYRAGGGTSRFMPNFMNDYFSYHLIQKEKIIEYDLSDDYIYYSNVEIVNVFHTWLLMCARQLDKESFTIEYNKWIDNSIFIQDVYSIKDKWENEFYSLIIKNNIKDIYEFIMLELKKNRFKNIAKQLLFNICKYID